MSKASKNISTISMVFPLASKPVLITLVKILFDSEERIGNHLESKVSARGCKRTTFPGLEKIFVDEANKEQITDITFDEWIHRNVDAMIYIRAASNTKELTNVDPEKLVWRQQAMQPLLKEMMKGGIRWVITEYPTNASAQDAEMSLEEYEDFVYGATNID
jgi:aminopeptidase